MSNLINLNKLEAVAREYRRQEDMKKNRRTIVASGTSSEMRELKRFAARNRNMDVVVR